MAKHKMTELKLEQSKNSKLKYLKTKDRKL